MADPVNNACTCAGCQQACAYRPGFFRREQIEPLAAALGLTVPELVRKHLQIDFWAGPETDHEETMMLVPRLKGQRGGTQIGKDPRGVCHWLIAGRCAIHTLGKPAECVALQHNKDGGYLPVDRGGIAATWREHEEFIEAVAGGIFFPHEADLFSWASFRLGHYVPNPDMPDPYADG